jgi:hypothetical protein
MKRAITIALTCTVAVLLPASVAAAGGGNGKEKNDAKKLTSKACVAEKKALKEELGAKAGKAAFRAIYGKHAMRNCKKGTAEEVETAQLNASQECRAERDADPEAFAEQYGTNTPGGEKSKGTNKNAFGKCVSGKVKEEVEDDVEDTVNAARECREARDADPEAFAEEWGTNTPNENSKGAKRNAFGKCVSATAKQADEEEAAGVPAPTI